MHSLHDYKCKPFYVPKLLDGNLVAAKIVLREGGLGGPIASSSSSSLRAMGFSTNIMLMSTAPSASLSKPRSSRSNSSMI